MIDVHASQSGLVNEALAHLRLQIWPVFWNIIFVSRMGLFFSILPTLVIVIFLLAPDFQELWNKINQVKLLSSFLSLMNSIKMHLVAMDWTLNAIVYSYNI